MFMERKLSRALVVVATLALYACLAQVAAAKGGHGGGGHHGGGHHAGGHDGGHNHHAYHPSHHHASHHSGHHDHYHDGHHDPHHDGHHHYAHHHHGWHHGGWGPGYWGAAGLGYGLGYAYGNWGGYGYDGGNTYVDNSTNVTPTSNESAGDDSDTADDSNNSNDENTAANAGSDQGFPTDDWPELGVVTYAGQYGGSQGQVVVRVVPGSAADEAGAVPGDVILTFNGKPVPSADDLDAAMDGAAGKFELQVWDARTGRKSVLDGTLDPAAKAPPTSETAASPPVQQ